MIRQELSGGKKMRKLVLGIMATALAGCMFTGAAMADELLPGGGSNIIYIITPST